MTLAQLAIWFAVPTLAYVTTLGTMFLACNAHV